MGQKSTVPTDYLHFTVNSVVIIYPLCVSCGIKMSKLLNKKA